MTPTTIDGGASSASAERTVFLDETGRRARWVRAAGTLIPLATAAWCAALVAGSAGFNAMPAMVPSATERAARISAHAVRTPPRLSRTSRERLHRA